MSAVNLEKLALQCGAQHLQDRKDLVLAFNAEALAAFARALLAPSRQRVVALRRIAMWGVLFVFFFPSVFTLMTIATGSSTGEAWAGYAGAVLGLMVTLAAAMIYRTSEPIRLDGPAWMNYPEH